MQLDVGRKRPGSILATSISLVAVFLTLVLGSMVYVQNTMSQARTERLRTSAEEAARSGMELVMGWAEANIDQETRLPKRWDSMSDGEILDPIGEIMENAGSPPATLAKTLAPGQVIGVKHNEYVVGYQYPYVTTFKARIQQFRLSDDMPRQYRIGVVGRVRKLQPSAGAGDRDKYNNIDNWERESVVAERVLVSYVGKEVTSRYAALIDIDSVKNWVPGEVVTGPVHINRGYVDEPGFMDINGDMEGTASGVTGMTMKDLRSSMMLYIDGQTGNIGFKTPPGKLAYPVFESQVSVTEMRGDTKYKADDPADGTPPYSVNVNGQKFWKTDTVTKNFHDKIFLAPENSVATRYGEVAGNNLRGPLIVKEPIELPRSIRNALGAAVGMPGNFVGRDRWEDLPNGVYVPTPRFWAINPPAIPDEDAAVPTDSYALGQAALGGIYVRGDVEAMRFGIGDTAANKHLSWYLFQVGRGAKVAGPAGRRCYLVVADRLNRKLLLHAYPQTGANARIHGNIIPAAGTTLATLLTNAGISDNSATWSGTASPASFSSEGTDTSARNALFGAPSSEFQLFPFNGVIYVDCDRQDPARPSTDDAWKSMAVTGNILALGNLGAKTNPFDKSKYKVGSTLGEVVATYVAAGHPKAVAAPDEHKSPASKLTIMARGNIFIQNNLYVEGVLKEVPVPATGRADLTKIKLEDSKDVLGLVADKQIVVGAAGSTIQPQNAGNRDKAGIIIMASIAGLGDPAYRPWNQTIDSDYLTTNRKYIGSFTSEGLMQAYAESENYYIKSGNTYPAAKAALSVNSNSMYSNTTVNTEVADGYPGNPIYQAEGYTGLVAANPNTLPRGRMVLFGAVTQKKRGIVGQGNQSYDKDFIFDKRLLSIAPPIFPSSVNVLVRTQAPFSPDNSDPTRALPYAVNGTIKQVGDLDFLGATPAGETPEP